MSIERAEKLKAALTDKYVLVDAAVPELKRFENWTGKVRTVNMNCRALVEFDGPVDIGWYDIDPDYLKVVDAPVKKAPAPAKAPAAKAPAAEAKPAVVKPAAGKSPLDMIRKQQAAKAAAAQATPAPEAPPAPVAEAQPQPAAVEVPAPAAVPEAPKPIPTTGPDGKPLSKLDIIRMQGAAKR